MQNLQGKLLRALESRSFCRLGSLKELPLRARVIAATNQNLKACVEEGTFRLDLFQRLCVFPIHIPPLRERGDDVILLAEHFCHFFAQKLGKTSEPLNEAAREKLLNDDFPGYVRELKNIIKRAVIMSESGRLELKLLPQRILESRLTKPDSAAIPFDFVPGIDTLESLEKRMISHALKRAKNVETEAARLLGISRFQLLRRFEKYGITE